MGHVGWLAGLNQIGLVKCNTRRYLEMQSGSCVQGVVVLQRDVRLQVCDSFLVPIQRN